MNFTLFVTIICILVFIKRQCLNCSRRVALPRPPRTVPLLDHILLQPSLAAHLNATYLDEIDDVFVATRTLLPKITGKYDDGDQKHVDDLVEQVNALMDRILRDPFVCELAVSQKRLMREVVMEAIQVEPLLLTIRERLQKARVVAKRAPKTKKPGQRLIIRPAPPLCLGGVFVPNEIVKYILEQSESIVITMKLVNRRLYHTVTELLMALPVHNVERVLGCRFSWIKRLLAKALSKKRQNASAFYVLKRHLEETEYMEWYVYAMDATLTEGMREKLLIAGGLGEIILRRVKECWYWARTIPATSSTMKLLRAGDPDASSDSSEDSDSDDQ